MSIARVALLSGLLFGGGALAIGFADAVHDREREGNFHIQSIDNERSIALVGSSLTREYNLGDASVSGPDQYHCKVDGSIMTLGVGMHYLGFRETLSDCSPAGV